MTSSQLDLMVRRGTTFELELVSQVKKYTYDPAVHNSAADLKRTHAENLEYYGFIYEYVDFATMYPTAVLEVVNPWQSEAPRSPLLTLTKEAGEIELTDKSVKIGISAENTQLLDFDKGNYQLTLITAAGKVDGLIHGTFTVEGD